MIHQGELLKKKVSDIKPDLQEFADCLEMTTQNLYNLYKREKIQKHTLESACNFLGISITEFQLTPNKSNSSVNNVTNEIVEELRANIDRLERSEAFLQNLVMQQFQMLNTKLDKLGKHRGIENEEGEKVLFKVA